MGLCKLCRTKPAGGKSHLIPKAFHRDMLGDVAKPSAVMLLPDSQQITKRIPQGMYDDDLVCPTCEGKFGPWDTYGAECLLQNFDKDTHTIAWLDARPRFYESTVWNESLLRMFVISVLWRAHATTLPFFEHAKIGSHSERLRNLILSGNPGRPDDFAVVFSRWYSNFGAVDAMKAQYPPTPMKVEGVNFVHLHFGGFVIGIKCDQRPVPESLAEITLRPDRAIRFLAIEYTDQLALGMIENLRRANRQPKLWS